MALNMICFGSVFNPMANVGLGTTKIYGPNKMLLWEGYLQKMVEVENLIHFVYPVWPNVRPLSYLNYISVLLARVVHGPTKIYFWVDKEPDNGGWWDKIRPLVTVRKIEMPPTYHGHPIEYPQIRSDVTRLNILANRGGIYMDTDMLLLKPLYKFMPKKFTMGLEPSDGEPKSACNALMLSKFNSQFVSKWRMEMAEAVKNDTWAYGGVVVPFQLYERFPALVDMQPAETFCPLDLKKNWLFSTDPAVIEETQEKIKNSYAVHAFETYWKDDIKNITPDWCKQNDSLFSRIVKELSVRAQVD